MLKIGVKEMDFIGSPVWIEFTSFLTSPRLFYKLLVGTESVNPFFKGPKSQILYIEMFCYGLTKGFSSTFKYESYRYMFVTLNKTFHRLFKEGFPEKTFVKNTKQKHEGTFQLSL